MGASWRRGRNRAQVRPGARCGSTIASRTRRAGTRPDKLFEALTAERVREGEHLPLAVYQPLETPLRDYTDAELVRAELDVLGMDASRHIISFFEPLLAELGVTRSQDLHTH